MLINIKNRSQLATSIFFFLFLFTRPRPQHISKTYDIYKFYYLQLLKFYVDKF
jgi:hypothetical protein